MRVEFTYFFKFRTVNKTKQTNLLYFPSCQSVTRLKGSVCLQESKASKTQTGACSKESNSQVVAHGDTDGSQGMDCIGEKSLITVTKGVRVVVRVMVSPDWSALGEGIVDQCSWS